MFADQVDSPRVSLHILVHLRMAQVSSAILVRLRFKGSRLQNPFGRHTQPVLRTCVPWNH